MTFHKHQAQLLSLLFFIGIAVFFTYPLGGDGDFFHHLNTGKFVIENLKIPATDTWTFTATGRPWVAYAWGMGVIYYFLFQTSGPTGISLLGSAMAVLTFWLLYRLLQNYGVSRFIALLVLAFAAPIIAVRWPNRPELVTYPMVAALLLIDRLRQQRPPLVFLTPLLILLWANLYGSSVFVGLGLLFINALSQLFSDDFKLVKRHLLVYITTLLSFVTAFINPFGWRAIAYIFVIPEVAKIQGEWSGVLETLHRAPITYLLPFQYRALLYGIYLAFVVFLILLSLRTFTRVPLLATYAIVLVLPVFIFRHLPLGVVLSIPFVGVLITHLSVRRKKLVVPLTIIIALLSFAVSLWLSRPGFGVDPNDYPPQLVKFLKTYEISGRIYNTQQAGGFLTYYFYPNMLVYFDTRDDLFINTPILTNITDVFTRQSSILPALESYSIDAVIVDLSEGPPYQTLFNTPTWTPVYLGGHYAVFVKPSFAKEKSIPIYEAIDPFRPTMAKIGYEEQAVKEYQSLLPLEPNFINNKLRLATALFHTARYDDVITTLANFPLQNNPRTPMFLALRDYLLVQAYFAKGDCDNTKRYLHTTWVDTHGKFLFAPDKVIPSPVNKGYAFFYLVCKRDKTTARRYLSSYLAEPDVEPGEKLRTSQIFNATIVP